MSTVQNYRLHIVLHIFFIIASCKHILSFAWPSSQSSRRTVLVTTNYRGYPVRTTQLLGPRVIVRRNRMNPICYNEESSNVLPPFLTSLKGVASNAASCATAASAIVGGASVPSQVLQQNKLLSSMYLVRIVFLRGLAFVYGIAFLIAYRQNKALIGDNGITPARNLLNNAEKRSTSTRKDRQEWIEKFCCKKTKHPIRNIGNKINRNEWYQTYVRERFWDRQDRSGRVVTTLLWLANDRNNLNRWLDGISIFGLVLSVVVFVLGTANFPLLFCLWVCQRSLMSVGGTFYGYGWEPQLAELGFHSFLLFPFLTLSKFAGPPIPYVPVYLIRLYLFRIMMGAGLIKMRGDKKWKDLTVMDYFYETQPIPNPLTKYFHFMPKVWHKFEVLSNHFVELLAPILLIIPALPTNIRRAGGLIQMTFQIILIISGNLSFLNWLTLVPAILCLDDAFVSPIFSASKQTAAVVAASYYTGPTLIRKVAMIALTLLIGKLSIPVMRNLFFTKKQIMNTSFDKLRLVNTYGAFGSVNENRYELIISSASNVNGPWKEYTFHGKPGKVYEKPKFISPYHHRLDWQLWIACVIGPIERSTWLYSFLLKLLQQDKEVIRLLKKDPWSSNEKSKSSRHGDGNGQDIERPKYIRIDKYLYKFHRENKETDKQKDELEDSSNKRKQSVKPYWDREYIGRFSPKQGVETEETLAKYLS